MQSQSQFQGSWIKKRSGENNNKKDENINMTDGKRTIALIMVEPVEEEIIDLIKDPKEN